MTYGLTLLWFGWTYVGLALSRIPGLRLDRAGIALVGATLCLVTGLLSFDQAIAAVDHATLVLLFALMIVVGYLRLAGFFEKSASWILSRLRRPRSLLLGTIMVSGWLSAFLVNDVVCLALAPLVIQMTRRLGLKPAPYLIGLATAANIGSTATITGNPQNMIIGSLSHIPYLRFTLFLGPVALMGLVLDFILISWWYRREFSGPEEDLDVTREEAESRPPLRNSRRLKRGLAVTLVMVVLFFAGLPIVLVALGAAALLLLDRINPEKIYPQIDWALLVMFTGLFVVVQTFELTVIRPLGLDHWEFLQTDPIGLLSLLSAGLSNLVSNVPAVLLFKPAITSLAPGSQETAWLALAMSSTLAGNLTILGSVANLIVVEIARREGILLSFREYCAIGIPLTLITVALGASWLYLWF